MERSGNKEMETNKFDRLMQSANQALEHAEGKRSDLRTTVLPLPPKALDNLEIVNLREKLHFSQAVFARHLNVSVKTIQSWEQGIGKPSGASLKLLSLINRRPTILVELA